MKKPDHVTTIETFHNVKAKALSKGDSVSIGGQRTYKVKSNKTNDYGQRVLHLRWGTRRKKDEVLLIVHRNFPFTVKRVTHVNNR